MFSNNKQQANGQNYVEQERYFMASINRTTIGNKYNFALATPRVQYNFALATPRVQYNFALATPRVTKI